MKTIDFIKQFHANPHAYTISKIPATIASRIRCESDQRQVEEKKIMINLPDTIDDTNAFPEWEQIQSYYRYYRRYEAFILSHQFTDLRQMKVEYIVKKVTIFPEAIRYAINKYIESKTKDIKFRIKSTQTHLENTQQKLDNYKKIMQVLQTCKE